MKVSAREGIGLLYRRCREDKPINNNHNHKMKSSVNKMTQWFFTEVHLLPGKLVPVVAMHPLDVSQANGQCQIPWWELARNIHKMGILQTTDSTRVGFRESPARIASRPLTIHRSETKHKHPASLNNPATPSGLACRETRKSNKQSQPPWRTNATRCNLQSKCTWTHSILLKSMQSSKEMSGEEYAQLKGC